MGILVLAMMAALFLYGLGVFTDDDPDDWAC